MKKSVFSVLCASALIAAMTFSATSCGGSESDNSKDNASNIQVVDTAKIDHDGFTPTTNIRYIDSDSIIHAYDYAKQELAKLDQKSLELQQYQNTLAAQIQKKANEIQQKANNNTYLTQASYEADMAELQKLQQNAETSYAKKAQDFSIEMAKVQETIIKAIENYVIKYNQDKKYDAILLKTAGVYFNPELDITQEIIKGLNGQTTSTTSENDK